MKVYFKHGAACAIEPMQKNALIKPLHACCANNLEWIPILQSAGLVSCLAPQICWRKNSRQFYIYTEKFLIRSENSAANFLAAAGCLLLLYLSDIMGDIVDKVRNF